MKKTLLILFAMVAGFHFRASATHDIGGSLTYTNVAPNVYIFKYSHYNWGGLANAQKTYLLNIFSPNCSVSRSVPLTFQTQHNSGIIPPTHGSTSYKISDLTAVVTFTPAEAACGNMVAAVTIGTGQPAANLAGISNVSQITEATLNLTPGIHNNAPEFDPLNEPVLVANKFQPITLSVGATDSDGDSLVYRLVAPLTAHNQPITNYLSWSGAVFHNPNPQPPYSNPGNPQMVTIPGVSAYSPTFPLMSYNANWNAGQVVVGNPYFFFDPQTGTIAFIPMVYDSTANRNIYLVSFQVDEYRNINGVATKIGSIRRETVIIVGNGGSNLNPRLSNIRANTSHGSNDSVYRVSAGSTFTLQFDGDDANAADMVYLQSNAATALPGATFTLNGTSRQSGTITWTPTAAQARPQPYYLRVWAKDNASPFAGSHVQTIALRVSNNGSVMAVKAEKQPVSFIAYPNPFREEVTFRQETTVKAREIIIYNTLGREIDRMVISAEANQKADLRWSNAAKFPAGTYIARLVAENKTTQTLKFTKLR